MNKSLLRDIPKVDDLLRSPTLAHLFADAPRVSVTEALREELDNIRKNILDGALDALPCTEDILSSAAERARLKSRPSLRGVINGTGVVLHTNLGRACLAREAVDAVINAATGYSTLEYDVASGSRGERYSHVERLLSRLTGAESAMVVNNNAAAVLLILSALAKGGEVIVSRGELVEIGGSFRVPEIMESCGAKLREVGTTNKTHLADYERAIGEDTCAIMKVHTSNYRIVGFTETVTREEMGELAHRHNLPFIEDLGSGCLFDLNRLGIRDEPTVQECVRAGVDVLSFSGDKLLGGPQGGIIVGKKECIDMLKKHPLTRAMRVDKMTLAALEATLRCYDEQREFDAIPTLNMLGADADALRAKGEKLCQRLNAIGAHARCVPVRDQVGGGSVPMQLLDAYAVAIELDGISPERLEKHMRLGEPSIIGRIDHARYLLHMRTIAESEFDTIERAIAEAMA